MQRKNILIAGGIAAALLAIGGVAFAAGKSGSSTEAQTPTVPAVTVTAPPPAPKSVIVTAPPVTAPPVTVTEPAPPPVTVTVTEPAPPPVTVTVTEQAPPASGGSSGGGSDTSLSDATECNADAMALAETDPEASIRKSAECLRILGY